MFFDLKEYAKAHNIPIITDDGLLFLKTLIKDNNVKNILEIGTAIGYSALNMASYNTNVVSLEKDEALYNIALENIKQYNYEDKVCVILHDATKDYQFTKKFDLIFIDGAKAQYIKFFTNFKDYLNPKGIIVTDNLSFHNLKPENVNRHTRQLLRKIESFKTFLKENQDYETIFYNIGDGMSVSKRR